MKHTFLPAIVMISVPLWAGTVLAADRCDVAKAEWQPTQALQQKLEAQGWKVTRIGMEDGCYEAYALDQSGRRVEAYFNPKTLEPVKAKADR